ncbi:MAG: hypothetical protein LBD11_05850 [Candidatus Peribacteria bacterium]|jgi:hypothetical protein|nr:hypothetical protein [Candidatus Peribacteria bacterium]
MKKIFLRIFSIVLVFALGAIFFKEMLPECRPNPIQATRTLKYIGLEPQIDGIDLTETSLHWQTSDTSPTIHVLIPYPLRTIELSEIAIGASAFIDRTSLRIFSGEVKYLSEEVGDIWYEAVRIDSLTKKEREPVDCSILANTDAYKQCIWATEDDLGVDAMEENSEPE